MYNTIYLAVARPGHDTPGAIPRGRTSYARFSVFLEARILSGLKLKRISVLMLDNFLVGSLQAPFYTP